MRRGEFLRRVGLGLGMVVLRPGVLPLVALEESAGEAPLAEEVPAVRPFFVGATSASWSCVGVDFHGGPLRRVVSLSDVTD